jgi:hypothetical protein
MNATQKTGTNAPLTKFIINIEVVSYLVVPTGKPPPAATIQKLKPTLALHEK